MICDTNFLSELYDEQQTGMQGPAAAFLARHRPTTFLITVISLGEVAVIFAEQADARRFLSRYRTLKLTAEIGYTAALIERELMLVGGQLGENDNWIAGFCRYYGQPLISRDTAFDRVRGLRRVPY